MSHVKTTRLYCCFVEMYSCASRFLWLHKLMLLPSLLIYLPIILSFTYSLSLSLSFSPDISAHHSPFHIFTLTFIIFSLTFTFPAAWYRYPTFSLTFTFFLSWYICPSFSLSQTHSHFHHIFSHFHFPCLLIYLRYDICPSFALSST